MKLRATQDHINRGVKGNASSCPLAQALTDAGFKNVRVYSSYVNVGEKKADIPPPVSDWIAAFDQGRTVGPIEVEINL